MISSRLSNPPMLAALAAAGHGSTVLITDGHYPAKTAVGRNAVTVHLNLEAGVPTVPAVLATVLDTVAIECATVIRPSADATPCAVHDEVTQLLPNGMQLHLVDRFDFYDLARGDDLALCVVTGDTRRFANVLLTLGVLKNPV